MSFRRRRETILTQLGNSLDELVAKGVLVEANGVVYTPKEFERACAEYGKGVPELLAAAVRGRDDAQARMENAGRAGQ